MSIAMDTPADHSMADAEPKAGDRARGPTVAFVLVLLAYTFFLALNFIPAIVEPDDNGYFAQASLLFTTGRTWFAPASDAQYIGMHWLLTPDGNYISRYPPGLAVVIGLVYAIGGFKAAVFVNPALSILTLVGTWFFGRRVGLSRWWPLLPVVVLATNPTFIHHALAGDSHMSVACALVWGLTLLLRWSQGGRAIDLFFAGLVLGLIPTIRYPDAIVAVGVAAFILSHWRTHTPIVRHLVAGAIGVAIPVVPLLIRNQLLLGGFWKTGYALTKEQTGFSFEFFRLHALQYIGQLHGSGVGLFFVLGLIGITLLLCSRGTRSLGMLFATVTLPMLVLYMAYYWAPAMPGATMRFLLPTFAIYVVAGALALSTLTKHSPRGARIAVPAVLACVQLLWAMPDAQAQLRRMSGAKRPLAMMVDALERTTQHGDVIVANDGIGELAQHLDFVRQWKVADSSLASGSGPFGGPMGGGPPGGGGGPMGGGPPMNVMGPAMGGLFGDGGPGGPSPMQAEKREAQRALYPGTTREKQAKFAADLETWADGGSIWLVGTEAEVKAIFSDLDEPNLEIVERIDVLRPAMFGGMGPGMGPGGGGPGGGGRRVNRGGGSRANAPAMGPGGQEVEWVIARWTPKA